MRIGRFVFASRADALIDIGERLKEIIAAVNPPTTWRKPEKRGRNMSRCCNAASRLFDNDSRRRHWPEWYDFAWREQYQRLWRFTIVCNDGRTGIAMATNDTALSGGGKVRLSDGMEADFIFGEAARRI